MFYLFLKCHLILHYFKFELYLEADSSKSSGGETFAESLLNELVLVMYGAFVVYRHDSADFILDERNIKIIVNWLVICILW